MLGKVRRLLHRAKHVVEAPPPQVNALAADGAPHQPLPHAIHRSIAQHLQAHRLLQVAERGLDHPIVITQRMSPAAGDAFGMSK